MRIAIQGEPGSFSHEAALKARPQATILSCTLSAEVFAVVNEGAADAAMIPIENSLAGSVPVSYTHLDVYKRQFQTTEPVPINISITSLGAGDEVVLNADGSPAQGGLIDWGDGLGAHTIPLTQAGPLSLSNTYAQQGKTTIYVMAWAQYKYQNGGGSGSYGSCVDGTATLTIEPYSPLRHK